MSWDSLTLIILASFGCLTLLLTQVGEVLSKLPQIIRAWREVRDELRNSGGVDLRETDPGANGRTVPRTPGDNRSNASSLLREAREESATREPEA